MYKTIYYIQHYPMVKKLIYSAIIALCIVYILDVYNHHIVVPNVNIHNLKFIDISLFQKYLNSKYPTVVVDTYDQLPHLYRGSGVLTDVSYVSNLLSPMRISSHMEYIHPDGKIRTTYNNRTLLFQIEGTITIWLFHPSQTGLLYVSNHSIKENGHYVSPILLNNDVNVDDHFPLFKHSAYTEITLSPHMLLSIPNRWSYCIKNDSVVSDGDNNENKNTKTAIVTSNTLGSITNFLLR